MVLKIRIGYYMRFKINGTQVEYKGQVEGTLIKQRHCSITPPLQD